MKFLFFLLLAHLSLFAITPLASAEQTALFSLQSTSFSDRKNLPALYTCDGRDLSPQLSWSGAPSKTVSFVLICDDPDAPSAPWYHWVLYNIPATVSQLPAGVGPIASAALGQNSWGGLQYKGPCPPASSLHRYNFTLYALDVRLQLPGGADAPTLLKAIQGHVLGKTALMAVFGH